MLHVLQLEYHFSQVSNIVFCIFFQHLRSIGVVGKFVEFFGPGVAELSIADRATISNMCPEYGATVGYFPVDEKSLSYLRQTGKCFYSQQTYKWDRCCYLLMYTESERWIFNITRV